MYDIGSMLKQNDHLAEFSKNSLDRKNRTSENENFENRINFVEAASQLIALFLQQL